jgi:glycosyltransferase involved in cell wall biosynthesis
MNDSGTSSRSVSASAASDTPRHDWGDSTVRMPAVSVIIPTRNRRGLLRLTLQSVLQQRAVAFEVVVVNDGSTDGSGEMVQRLQDPRVSLIEHETSRGVAAARNEGIAAARSEWIAFLDDDDLWAPDKLSLQLRAARDSGRSWVYVGHVNINGRNRVTGGDPPLDPEAVVRRLPRSNVVPGGCSGVMATKRAIQLAGNFDVQLQPLADWDLWLRLAKVGLPACVSRPLVAYSVHGFQMSLDAARVEAEFRILAARHGEGDRVVLYRYLGWWALRVKSHREALRFFARARLQNDPDYPIRVFGADLVAVARSLVDHRFWIRSGRRSSGQDVGAHSSWRAEGQAWVTALVGDETMETDGPHAVRYPPES